MQSNKKNFLTPKRNKELLIAPPSWNYSGDKTKRIFLFLMYHESRDKQSVSVQPLKEIFEKQGSLVFWRNHLCLWLLPTGHFLPTPGIVFTFQAERKRKDQGEREWDNKHGIVPFSTAFLEITPVILPLCHVPGLWGIPSRKMGWDFPGGSVDKNLPANAGYMGLIPSPGRSHMLRSNSQQLKPVLHNKRSQHNDRPVSHKRK